MTFPTKPNRPRLVELRAPSPVKRRGTSILLYLASLRQAVGNSFRNGVLATQNAGNELVRVDLTSPGGNTIWLLVYTERPVRAQCYCSRRHDMHVQRTLGQHYRRAKVQQLRAMFKEGGDSHGPTEFRQQQGRLAPHRAVTPIAG
jgi:hypothetical protein